MQRSAIPCTGLWNDKGFQSSKATMFDPKRSARDIILVLPSIAMRGWTKELSEDKQGCVHFESRAFHLFPTLFK